MPKDRAAPRECPVDKTISITHEYISLTAKPALPSGRLLVRWRKLKRLSNTATLNRCVGGQSQGDALSPQAHLGAFQQIRGTVAMPVVRESVGFHDASLCSQTGVPTSQT